MTLVNQESVGYLNPPPLDFVADRLAGRVTMVTGASSGIGEAAARRFAAEGAIVVAAARRLARLEPLVEEIRETGREALAVQCDVTDESSGRAAVDIPMNYIAHADDMARAALFLLSDEARWITGHVLPCEGVASSG